MDRKSATSQPAASRSACCTTALTISLICSIVVLILYSDASPSRPDRRFLPLAARGLRASPSGASSAAAVLASGAACAPPQPPDLGAVFIYYNNPKAVIHVLKKYRSFYPAGDLFMACDDGCQNLTAIADYYGAVHDGRAHRITSKIGDNTFHMYRREAHVYIDVLAEALRGIRQPYFIQLQNDVDIRKRVASPLLYDMNGYGFDKAILGGPEKWLRSKNPHALERVPVSGIGGSIHRTAFFRDLLNRPDIHALVDELYVYANQSYRSPIDPNGAPRLVGNHHNGLGDDYLLTTLCAAFNGTVGHYWGFVEEWPIDWHVTFMKTLNTIEVLHNFKEKYGQGLTDEEKAIAGPNYEEKLPRVDPATYAHYGLGGTWPNS